MENPYKILGLLNSASKEEVKRAFYYVAKMYHPDKGGNPEQYNKFKVAYATIMNNDNTIRSNTADTNSRSWNQLRDSSQAGVPVIQRNSALNGRFNVDKFNETFSTGHTNTDDTNGYVYNIDDSQYKERTKNSYEREHSKITEEAESVAKMFDSRGFDKNIFNRMFEHKKQKHKENSQEIEEVTEPEPLSAGDSVGGNKNGALTEVTYSDVELKNTENLTSLGYAEFDIYSKCHSNPSNFDREMMSEMSNKDDITKQSALSQRDAIDRINKYKQYKVENKQVPVENKQDPIVNNQFGSQIDLQNDFQQRYTQQHQQPQQRYTQQLQTQPQHYLQQQQQYLQQTPQQYQYHHPQTTQPQNMFQQQSNTGHYMRQQTHMPINYPTTSIPIKTNIRPQERLVPRAMQINASPNQFQPDKRTTRVRRNKVESELRQLKSTIKQQQRMIDSLVRRE